MENLLMWRRRKNVFWAFLINIWDPENFTFSSENGPKLPNEWGSGKSKKKPTLPGTLPTPAIMTVFPKITFKKL